ncbi:plexin domain-containing protein 2 isoform X3 [Lingula anatina]|uniref:Plexin domain-containing protein 2 isoform X1 n=1 Tax=Lingula anatina TaxID=7574 RepID=A0A1S3HF67_LINAN|nr:plexin domain-containing protein 2 isoform X1 [Lingula anatina]XP_013384719.1 plexin domain-containing protein 2 isoform X2 [Lingula anatina]XP_013384720.1 plexin domain-containing protein 2 isoform X3 [Lingula anatina]|eukprot:XP_013384717.1 plexin domain-containing protein 2 isoform X1 [Lingula anatina]
MAGATLAGPVLLIISIFITYLSSAKANEAISHYSYVKSDALKHRDVMVEGVRSHLRVKRQNLNPTSTTQRVTTTTLQTNSPSRPTSSPVTPTSPSVTPTSPSVTPTSAPSTTTLPLPTSPPLDKNTTIGVVDDHTYYYSKFSDDDQEFNKYWVDLESMRDQRVHHETLSDAHQTAARIHLTSKFIFYGHTISQVTIATGGFIYMSDFLHQRLTATQYVAPLMANFDTRIGNENSNIYYFSNETILVVHWDKVHLKDNPGAGNFTFQLLLKNSGEIYFVYKIVPVSVPAISSAYHPVKVGVSDAYYIDRLEPNTGMTFRTIYEYDRIVLDLSKVRSKSVYKLFPLATCNIQTTCDTCTTANLAQFNCSWCQKLNKCSDGMDRHRQAWQLNGCHQNGLTRLSECLHSTTTSSNPTTTSTSRRTPAVKRTTDAVRTAPPKFVPTGCHLNTKQQVVCSDITTTSGKSSQALPQANSASGTIAVVLIVIFIIVILIIGTVAWLYYAYKNPTTRSGQWLIKHRPSEWKFSFSRGGDSNADKYRVDMQSGQSTA